MTGLTAPASATTFLNGDFSSGNLNDFDIRRCSFLCVPDTTNSAGIANNAGDNYLRLTSPTFAFGLGQIEVSQTFNLMASAPVLSFDAGIISNITDPFMQTPDGREDAFSLFMRDGSGNLLSLFRLTASLGATKSPSAPNPDDLSITALTGSFFDYNFKADLSDYAGQNISLIFLAISREDQRVIDFGVDNIAFSRRSTVTTVPLPAGGVLVFTGMISLFGLRRLRRRTT